MRLLIPLVLCATLWGCGKEGIQPGDNDYEAVQMALLSATPGSVVLLGEGRFRFNMGLSLTVDRVTLRGMGRDKTVLSFKDQKAGSQGLLVKANGFTAEDLAVEDSAGDAIKVEGGKGVTFRRVRTEWTRGSNTDNGAYGIYPVQCQQVLVEDCVVIGASDAGIYVGQSDTVIVRRSRVEKNVAGIEIENTRNADVYDNVATGNTAGIAVFALPGLQVKGGGRVRVYNNQMVENNTDNFAAKGNTVAQVPRGTGTFVMANRDVEVFGNTIKDNMTANMGIISYIVTQNKYDDQTYDPYPKGVYVHDNSFSGGGDSPDVDKELGQALIQFVCGPQCKRTPVPDVIYDGVLDPAFMNMVPDDQKICIKNNKHDGAPATFANIDGENLLKLMPNISRDLTPHDCTHPALPAITIPGVTN